MAFTKKQWEEWKRKNPEKWEERRRKLSESHKGKKLPKKHRKKISEKMKGKKKSEEHRKKISESVKKRIQEKKLKERKKIIKKPKIIHRKISFPGKLNYYFITIIIVIVLFSAIILSGTFYTALIVSEYAWAENWENKTEVIADKSMEKMTLHIIFDEYKPKDCKEGIYVTDGIQDIDFEIVNPVYVNNTCIETDIVFENLIYAPCPVCPPTTCGECIEYNLNNEKYWQQECTINYCDGTTDYECDSITSVQNCDPNITCKEYKVITNETTGIRWAECVDLILKNESQTNSSYENSTITGSAILKKKTTKTYYIYFGKKPKLEIKFDRDPQCHKCGKHKAPPLANVNMSISADFNGTLHSATFADYYHKDWIVMNANGGNIVPYNETYNKIEWYVGDIKNHVEKWYIIKSPRKETPQPPIKYYFRSDLNKMKSDWWLIIVADQFPENALDELYEPCQEFINPYCTPNNVTEGVTKNISFYWYTTGPDTWSFTFELQFNESADTEGSNEAGNSTSQAPDPIEYGANCNNGYYISVKDIYIVSCTGWNCDDNNDGTVSIYSVSEVSGTANITYEVEFCEDYARGKYFDFDQYVISAGGPWDGIPIPDSYVDQWGINIQLPPQWNNQGQSDDEINSGDVNYLWTNWTDSSDNLDWAWLSTNETTNWVNYTDITTKTYTITGSGEGNNYAYYNNSSVYSIPENSVGNEFDTNEYNNISIDDGEYANHTVQTGQYAFHHFNFSINESEETITELKILWNGISDTAEPSGKTTLWIWDGSSYGDPLASESSGPNEVSLMVTFDDAVNISNYVIDGRINIKIYSAAESGFIATDYIELNVSYGKDHTSPRVLRTYTEKLTNFTWNNTSISSGKICWKIYANDSTDPENVTNQMCFDVTVANTPPTWSNNQSYTPSTYDPNTLSEFNVTWQDSETDVDTVFIEGNWSTCQNNCTMDNLTYGGSIYNYSEVLPAGFYYWKSYANDTQGAWNVSDVWNFTIQKGSTETYLYLNDSRDNITVNETATVNFTVYTNVSGRSVELWTNYSDGNWKLWDSSNEPLMNYTKMNEVGFFKFTGNFSGDQNYTGSTETFYVTVQELYCTGSDPYDGSDDWTITGETICENEDFSLNGNLTVNSGGTLRFINTTLHVNGSSDGEYNIFVDGSMFINKSSNITNGDTATAEFRFEINSGATAFQMNDSYLSEAGWHADYPGLSVTNVNEIIIKNNTINNVYYGLNITSSNNIDILDNDIDSGWTGIYVNTNNSNISGNEIFSTNYRGIDMRSSDNNTVSYNDVDAGNAYGLYMGGSDNNTFLYNNFTSDSTGFYMYSSENNNISNNNIINNNVNGIGFYLANNNTFLNNEITGNNKYGVAIDFWSSNNTFKNNTIEGNSEGVYILQYSNNSLFINNTIKTTGSTTYAFFSENSTGTEVYNSTLISVNNLRDVNLSETGNLTFVNVDFNKSATNFEPGSTAELFVKWYVIANVTDTSNNPIQDANVTAYNVSDIDVWWNYTNATGFTNWTIIQEYWQNATNKYFQTNYTFNATKSGYVEGSEEVNVTENVQVNITLSIIGCDPPASGNWNITEADNIVCEDKIIYLDGNLTIYGNLTFLKNVTLKLNLTHNGHENITVFNNGNFTIRSQSNITSNDTSYRFPFIVKSGSKFEMKDSELHKCGFSDASPYLKTGLVIRTNNTEIINNTFSFNYWAIQLSGSTCCHEIENNTFYNNTYAVILISSFGMNNFSIVNNTVYNHTKYGISIWQTYMASPEYPIKSFINITNNTVYYTEGNTGYGISVWGLANNSVKYNKIYNNTDGIYLYIADNNTVSDNNISHSRYGIQLHFADFNNVNNNTVYNQTYGIYLYVTNSNNTIEDNEIFNNKEGIYGYEYENYNNTLKNNTIYNNDYGIYLKKDNEGNIIEKNVIYNNDDGIIFYINSNNTITDDNNISFNSRYGVVSVESYLKINVTEVENNTNGKVLFAWSSRVHAINATGHDLQGAYVYVRNVSGIVASYNYSEYYDLIPYFITDGSGWTSYKRFLVYQNRTNNDSTTTNFNDHTFFANKTGVGSGKNITTMNESKNIVINVTEHLPSVSNVFVDDDELPLNNITLIGGYQEVVTCNGTVNDEEGYWDIDQAWAQFFDDDYSWDDSDDNNMHYTNNSCDLFEGSGESIYAECKFYVWYNANVSTRWNCNLTVNDSFNEIGWYNDTNHIDELLAIAVNETTQFGSMSPGETSSEDVNNTVTNYGNIKIDLKLNGSDMICSVSGQIQTEKERYNCTHYNQNYNNMAELTETSTSAYCTGFDLNKTTTPTGTPETSNKSLPWKIQIPSVSGVCNGTVWYIAIAG
ncbi:MAG: right-handed parallel beta-helix repeat-containing protein [Candidatus Aenigmatarchaeota archaeon]